MKKPLLALSLILAFVIGQASMAHATDDLVIEYKTIESNEACDSLAIDMTTKDGHAIPVSITPLTTDNIQKIVDVACDKVDHDSDTMVRVKILDVVIPYRDRDAYSLVVLGDEFVISSATGLTNRRIGSNRNTFSCSVSSEEDIPKEVLSRIHNDMEYVVDKNFDLSGPFETDGANGNQYNVCFLGREGTWKAGTKAGVFVEPYCAILYELQYRVNTESIN